MENFDDNEPQHDTEYCPENEDLISMDPSETLTKKLVIPSQYNDFEELGGLDNSHAPFDNVHNGSISECTDTIDNGYVEH